MLANKKASGVIVAGGGRFGCYLADQLNLADEDVTVIDINCESFDKLGPDFSGATVEGDASDIEVLRQAGISKARSVVAATDNDNVNLMIAQIAHSIYEVTKVVAVVSDVRKISTKAEFDFSIICPAVVMTEAVIVDLNGKEG